MQQMAETELHKTRSLRGSHDFTDLLFLFGYFATAEMMEYNKYSYI